MNATTERNHRDGNTILVVLMVLTLLSVAVVSALNLTSGVSRNVSRTNRYRDAVAAGDGALDYLFSHWYTKSKARSNTQLKGSDFTDIPMPPAELFPNVLNYAATRDTDESFPISNLRIQGYSPEWKPLGDDAEVQPAYGMNSGNRSYFYLASADVTLRNTIGSPMKVKARRIFEKEIGSPWMYAIFYTDRLEIHPGPEFHVTGWVHTNEHLFTAHDTLWLESKVTFVDGWDQKFAPNDGAHDPKNAREPHTNPSMPPRKEEVQAPMGMDKPDFNPDPNESPANANNDGYRELIERPDRNSPLDPDFEEQRYYNQADVKILVDPDPVTGQPVVTFRNNNDTVVDSTSTGTDLLIYQVFKDAVKFGDKIQDNREGTTIELMTIDMSKVNAAMKAGGPLYGKMNGVIYASDVTAGRHGVRLKNGGTMPPGGVTVVSDNPCYIQGDYNTGTTSTTQPASNLPNGDPTKNTVPGYQKQSCAVVADAVMIMSNAWSDTNSYNDLNQRTALPTTINTAIVSGIVPTGEYGTNYSGGAENFPRFLEKWGSGNTLTYYGSMVQLYKSLQNKEPWGKGNVYDPPKRKWYFDRQFYTDPPPGTLSTVKFKKSRWYQE
ncbi:MAG TPA: hypothetical protein VFG14_01510 [Chthoniobacteraceae bacterium]|jgi:hypothetical protein|nr:hypothetical protein [Chthoniobacteraceae bacterium]